MKNEEIETEIKQLKYVCIALGIVILIVFIIIIVADSIRWKAQLGFNDIVKEGIDDMGNHLINSKFDIQQMYRAFNLTQLSDSQIKKQEVNK